MVVDSFMAHPSFLLQIDRYTHNYQLIAHFVYKHYTDGVGDAHIDFYSPHMFHRSSLNPPYHHSHLF